jgi:hypothetical protein
MAPRKTPPQKGDKPELKKRKNIDWQSIEREFRAGATTRSIGVMFGVSHNTVFKRAKAEGWTQDLTEQVRRATRAKLVEGQVDKKVDSQVDIQVDRKSESELVNEAADIRATLIRTHQQRFSRLQRLGDKLAERLEAILDGNAVEGALCMGDRESPADLLRKVTAITATMTDHERRAFGIDDPAEQGSPTGGSDRGTFEIEFVKAADDGGAST